MNDKLKPIYLLQDNARELLGEDYLGMRAWVNVIAGAAVGNDGPFTIGIYKEWGYGKTTLLQLAQQAVDEYQPGPDESIVTVWFNAWQFEREERPLFPLIAAVTDAIELATRGEPDNKPSKLKKIGLSLRALTRGMKFKGDVGLPLLGKVGVEFDANKALTAEELIGQQTNPLQAELLYHSAFAALAEAAKGAGKAKTVVFIDDLDRCNPENAVRLLECIKLVLAQKGFVFVLAVDNTVIETYLDKVYKDKYGFKAGAGRGRKYLEKIVQLPLDIPPHEKRFPEYVVRLIDELAEKYKEDGESEDVKIAALRNVQEVLAAHVSHNPRRLVRLIDGFIIDAFLWEGTAELRTHYQELDNNVANAIAIHRVVHNALGEELTSALIDDVELRESIAAGTFGDHEKRDASDDADTAPEAPTLRDELEARLRESPDILKLLQSAKAAALLEPRKEDLWAAVRHFMTTTRAETPLEFQEFPDYLYETFRRKLKLVHGDPIPSSRLSEVKTLNLSRAPVTDAELRRLKGLAWLQELNLTGTPVTDAGMAHLEGLIGLQTLRLDNTEVTDAGLNYLKGLPGLRELFLDGTPVTDTGLAHLQGLRGLQKLGLNNTQVTGLGFALLKGLTGLYELRLSGTPVTDAGLAHLRGLSGLHTLDLTNTPVTDAGMALLKGFVKLQDLDLDGTEVTDVGLEHLKGLEVLHWLSLNSTEVTDVGLEHLKGLTGLYGLHLSNTPVTDAGLAHLKGLAGLQELHLSNTSVTDAGLEHLTGLKGLQDLSLGGTHTTGAGLAKLSKALPRCYIRDR